MSEKVQHEGVGFAHLHLHTEYSLLDGGNRIDKLMDRCKALGYKAVACTDHGNLFGAVHFYSQAKERGIKPILGVEAYVAPGDYTDRTYTGVADGGYHLVLLAENNAGWQNLLYLCSEAYLRGFYFKPRIDRKLLEAHSEGLIAINGHLGSEIGEHLLEYERTGEKVFWEKAVESAAWHARTFNRGWGVPPQPTLRGGALGRDAPTPAANFFIELQHHVSDQNSINKHLIRLAREMKLPLVCDNDSHFLRAEDHDAHDTLVCISTGKNKNDPDRMRYPAELYVKSPAEMAELFEAYGESGAEALSNAAAIAARCEVALPIGDHNAPMVRVKRKAGSLPKPGEFDDLSAWYAAYCACFEVVPFALPKCGEAEKQKLLAEAKKECDDALRLLAEAGFMWRYGLLGTPAVPAGSSDEKQPGGDRRGTQEAEKRERLERELKILADKGISAYFLIVWDFVNWGRQNGVPGLARGSGVGTMVGYVLGLSNACPVQFGLLFERFTDPDRSEYPDIDIDLCQDGRGRVIEYVRKKYGHVAQIITFGTLKAKAAIRDVARVLEIPLSEADKLAKLVPDTLHITLDEALAQSPDLKSWYDRDPQVQRCLDNARAIEGQARHASVHAAGVIVATRPLHEIVPLYKPSNSEETVTQWDGPTCEKMGLLKMDFLGLRTISVVERAKKLIRETLREEEIWRAVGRSDERRATSNEKDKKTSSLVARTSSLVPAPHPLDLDRIDFTNPQVFEMFKRGDTTGVFQFESPGMRRLLIEMKPDRLEDLIAANALFRPGPMDLIPDYNRRKHGQQKVPTVHPIVDAFTRETYGVMVYQEQVMQIVHGLGGIKLRDAYTLIKNISKKKHDKIEKERPKFVEGAQKQGLTKQAAEDLFELILKFAGYGFNKSHSTGYAIVAFQTAYLKTYFPNQYMAAFLTYESAAMQTADWVPYLEDCKNTRFIDPMSGAVKKVGVEVRPPDINLSDADFAVVFGPGEPHTAVSGHVRFGLSGVKGVGEKAIASILHERAAGGATSPVGSGAPADSFSPSPREGAGGGFSSATTPPNHQSRPFTSLHDFCERVPVGGGGGVAAGAVNKATIEALVKCGAMDGLHGRESRAAMIASIETAVAAGASAARDLAAGQGGLFGGEGAVAVASGAVALARVAPWSEVETLAHERDVLGFYVSNHPLDAHRSIINSLGNATTRTLRDRAFGQDFRVTIGVMITAVRNLVVKTGKSAGQRMAGLTLEDKEGSVQAVAFSDCYARYAPMITPDRIVFVVAKVDLSRGDVQLIVEKVVDITSAASALAKKLRVVIDETKLNGSSVAALEKAAGVLNEAMKAAPKPGGAGAKENGDVTYIPVEVSVRTRDAEVAVVPIRGGGSGRVAATPELVAALASAVGADNIEFDGERAALAKREPRAWEKPRFRSDDE